MRINSIHPRVSGGRVHFDKQATIKAPDKARIARTIASMDKHIDEHPLDQASKAHQAKLRAQL